MKNKKEDQNSHQYNEQVIDSPKKEVNTTNTNTTSSIDKTAHALPLVEWQKMFSDNIQRMTETIDFQRISQIMKPVVESQKMFNDNIQRMMKNVDFQRISQIMEPFIESLSQMFNSVINSVYINDLEDLNCLFEKFDDNDSNYIHYFRGQSNSSWGLSPTLFRMIDIFESHEILQYLSEDSTEKSEINLDKIFSKEIDEYNCMTNSDAINNKFSFYAFVQHAKQKSFMIDFSQNINVALSFALNTENYKKKESLALYVYEVIDGEQIDSEVEAQAFIDKVKVYVKGQSYLVEEQEETPPMNEEIVAKIIDVKTNDRMIYQEGVFLVFDNYLIDLEQTKRTYSERNHLLSANKIITKYIISYACIPEILKRVELDNSRYSKKYLMDPYLRIKE